MQPQETPATEVGSPRRMEVLMVIAGTAVVLAGFLYWTGMTLGIFQGSSLLHSASVKIAARVEPMIEPAPQKLEGPAPESRIASIKVATTPLPVPEARQLTTLDPFRDAGRQIVLSMLPPAQPPMDPAARKALEDRSLVSKTALPDGRTRLSITMNPTPSPAPVPSPEKTALRKVPAKSKPAASRSAVSSILKIAFSGYDLNRRESDRWVNTLAMAAAR